MTIKCRHFKPSNICPVYATRYHQQSLSTILKRPLAWPGSSMPTTLISCTSTANHLLHVCSRFIKLTSLAVSQHATITISYLWLLMICRRVQFQSAVFAKPYMHMSYFVEYHLPILRSCLKAEHSAVRRDRIIFCQLFFFSPGVD